MRVTATVTDSGGQQAAAFADYVAGIRGGYYLSGDGLMQTDVATIGDAAVRGFTCYRSFSAPAGASIFPGYQREYLNTWITQGKLGIFVLEPKCYTANAAPSPAQSFTVEGRAYSVPASNAQLTFPAAAASYGYGQFTSGALDGLLHRALVALRAMPAGPTVVEFGSEFDTYHQPNPTLGSYTEAGVNYTWAQADARAVAACSYVVDWFRNPPNGIQGCGPHVQFMIGVGGWDRTSWARLHPESLCAKLSAVNSNVYRTAQTHTALARFGRNIDWRHTDSGPICRSLPVYCTEWGTRATWSDQAAWIGTVPAALATLNARYPGEGRIHAAHYFNSSTDATLNPKPAGLAALRSAYTTAPFA